MDESSMSGITDSNQNGEARPLVTEQADTQAKRKCLKDLLAVSMVNMCILTAFNTIRDIETSLNRDVGIISLGCFNLGIVASTFLSPILFSKLKPKCVISLACVFHMIFVLSHFHPTLSVLVPCFVMLGLFFGPCISATGMYVTHLSIRYADACRAESHLQTLSVFNGVYFAFQQSAYVWGNILSSVLLFQVDKEDNPMNTTVIEGNCGSNFCPHISILPEVKPMETHMFHILLLILFASDVVGFFIATCILGNLEKSNTNEDENAPSNYKENIMKLFRLTFHKRMLLLIPLFMVTGVGMVLVVGSFPLAFVTCGLGMQYVGYTMTTMGLCNMLASLLCGVMGRWTGQMAVFVLGVCLLVALDVLLYLGHFNPENTYLFFVAAAVWGATDGLYQSQTGNIIGAVFPKQSKEGFVNWVLFFSISRASTFALSIFGCMSVQLIVYTVVTGIATICLIALYVKTGFRPEQDTT